MELKITHIGTFFIGTKKEQKAWEEAIERNARIIWNKMQDESFKLGNCVEIFIK